MTLRARLAIVAAVAVTVAIAVAALVTYGVTSRELRREVDRTLEERAQSVARAGRPGRPLLPVRPGLSPLLGDDRFTQVITRAGVVRSFGEGTALPVTARARDVATGDGEAFFADVTVDGEHLRVLTAPGRPGAGIAVQVARPLAEVDRVLRQLRGVLLAITVLGAAVAAGLAFLVARTALRPVTRLTEAVEGVTETRDLTRRIDVSGHDEVARLGERFNTMLAALDESMTAQRRFVSDASHELRTPVTSLRTNVEVLRRGDELTPADRDRLLRDIEAQTAELGALIGSLMDLERETEPLAGREAVALDQLVARAVDTAAFHWPDARFETALTPTVVHGVADRIERAVANLLDNAGKWSPPGGVVEVTVQDGGVTVRDHGPGIDPADVPFVFDRFWRAPAARAVPGSGLGLAIVAEVAHAHGASVSVRPAPGGGTEARLQFSATS